MGSYCKNSGYGQKAETFLTGGSQRVTEDYPYGYPVAESGGEAHTLSGLESLYYYFQKWQKQGVWGETSASLVQKEQERQGRLPEASAAAVDSQSVKKGSLISLQTGIDGNKNVNGRKRHLAVDTLALPLALHVSAASKPDGREGIELLLQLDKASSRLALIRADQAYKGDFTTCADYCHWQAEITQKPESGQGFVPQTGRWQVERSFAWFNFFRRLSRDFSGFHATSLYRYHSGKITKLNS